MKIPLSLILIATAYGDRPPEEDVCLKRPHFNSEAEIALELEPAGTLEPAQLEAILDEVFGPQNEVLNALLEEFQNQSNQP